jgi:hypothetical protein
MFLEQAILYVVDITNYGTAIAGTRSWLYVERGVKSLLYRWYGTLAPFQG